MSQPVPYRDHVRALLRLGLPLVGSYVAAFAIHTTDTIMLGWYDVTALAASTVSSSVWFLLFIMGAGFSHAITPLVAAAQEEDDETRARRVTRMGLWLSTGFSVLACALLWRSEVILLAMGQEPQVAAEGQRYLAIALFGFFPALWAQVLRSLTAGLHLTAIQLWVTLVALVLNALVNYALIFGNWGAPELGIRGAAIASVFTHLVQFVALAVYVQIKRADLSLYQRIWRPDPDALKQVFTMGVMIGLTGLAESGLFSASAVMMGWIGEIELAAHGIALQLAALTFMFHVGMSQAATIRTGSQYGRRDEAELRRGGRAAYGVSFAFAILVVTVFLTMPGLLVSVFIDPNEPQRDALIAIGTTLVLLAALFQFVDAAQIVAISLLRGVQDTTVPMWLASVSYWIIGLPGAYLMAFPLGLGAVGLWLGLTLGLAAAAVSLSWRFWTRSVRIADIPKVSKAVA